jgi:hypothetical protein
MVVETHAGYLVVDEHQRHLESIGLPDYRGLYRVHPWSEQEYEAGFNDPYVFGNYVNSAGLIPTVAEAHEVRERFLEVHPHAELEVLWTRECGICVDVPPDYAFLGIDVACTAPFWSILADLPPDAFVQEAKDRKNQNGLFRGEADARWYLSQYRIRHPESTGTDLFLWEVYAVPLGT